MATPKELRAALVENRAGLQEAFHNAAPKWETKPSGSAEGEDAWSPRQVAEHVIGAEWFFTNMIAQACGAPAMERPAVDASSPAKAASSLTRVAANNDNILRHVSDGDLAKEWDSRLGRMNVEAMLTTMGSHGQDHIAQMNAACG
jgi:hypothetical protein